MSSSLRSRVVAGYTRWSDEDDIAGVAFVGRGVERPRREVLARTVGLDRPVAWLRQVHGARVVCARPGCTEGADALTTSSSDLALAISTADCVPVVLAAAGRVAAVHAGWRGIVADVIGRALDAFAEAAGPPRAWVGPAIGACCYEVGPEVGQKVADACGSEEVVRTLGGSAKPHLDLVRAVRSQLARRGVLDISQVGVCTRCSTDLHSYRRDGSAGRNLAFAWLR